jgi:type IV secretory pathway TraG/TraD family ATPase VirD4
MDRQEGDITVFAETDFRNERVRFGIKRADRRHHLYVVGKTGMGKSTLLLNLIAADLRAGEGLAVLDPHGDLVEAALGLVSRERIQDVVYFDPADLDHPVGFNPLEGANGRRRHLVASGLISVFRKLWADFWGPRTEHILRYGILALLEVPGSTLQDLGRLLANRAFRRQLVARVQDPQVREFWAQEFEGYTARLRAEAVAPIQNKLGAFLASPLMRTVVGQARSAFDFREVIDGGKVLLANLAKGRVGEDASALLGAMLLTRIYLAALGRSGLPPEQRRDFYVYVDEFHAFVTDALPDMLSEARKYGLGLALVHQYLWQLEEKVREAIFGNVGTIISFRVGAEDAERLDREFSGVFREEDFVNLPPRHIYLRLMIDGVTSRGFSAVTLPPPEGDVGVAAEVVEASRERLKAMSTGSQEKEPTRGTEEPGPLRLPF